MLLVFSVGWRLFFLEVLLSFNEDEEEEAGRCCYGGRYLEMFIFGRNDVFFDI